MKNKLGQLFKKNNSGITHAYKCNNEILKIHLYTELKSVLA